MHTSTYLHLLNLADAPELGAVHRLHSNDLICGRGAIQSALLWDGGVILPPEHLNAGLQQRAEETPHRPTCSTDGIRVEGSLLPERCNAGQQQRSRAMEALLTTCQDRPAPYCCAHQSGAASLPEERSGIPP
eukprot:scaffold75666_cov24-Tisochrysis_lutea.AAC.1